jgi:hypothetical protein
MDLDQEDGPGSDPNFYCPIDDCILKCSRQGGNPRDPYCSSVPKALALEAV